MSKLQIEIADLRAILTDNRNSHTEEDLQLMEEDLAQYEYVASLWDTFQKVPVHGPTRTLCDCFHPNDIDGKPSVTEPTFPSGTPEANVLTWFETRFCLSVHEDLGYEGPWPGQKSCMGCAHNTKSKNYISSPCLQCRRYPSDQDTRGQKPDLYVFQPEKQAVNQPDSNVTVTAKPDTSCKIKVTVQTPITVTVDLTEKDITRWMDGCTDKNVLLRLATYAKYCATSMDKTPGDFRSRA